MGRVIAPFGIKGWVRVQAYTAEVAGFKRYKTWWLNNGAGSQEIEVEHLQTQGADVLMKFAGCEDRDAAAAFKGQVLAVARSEFAPASQGEFYWADLVGLSVKNSDGLELGVVSAMLETGANDVMVVKDGGEGEERLIPFIADVVKRVDVAARLIEVEWGADFLRN